MAFKTKSYDLNTILRNEGQSITYNANLVSINSVGSTNPAGGNYQNPVGIGTRTSTQTVTNGWRAATKPTIVANEWQYAGALLRQYTGRQALIKKIKLEVSGDCDVLLIKYGDTLSSIGQTSRLTYDNLTSYFTGSCTNAGGGTIEFEFDSSNLLTVRGGERIDLYYYRNNTTGINWLQNIQGWDVCNDNDYEAPLKFSVIGDSITGITSNVGDIEYVKREDGSKTGLWPFIIKQNLLESGVWSRQINMGQGGTFSTDWDWMCNMGKLQYTFDVDLLFINLGMNDAKTNAGISTVAGTDGTYKKSIKNLIRSYFRKRPSGTCIVNNITLTDGPNRIAAITGGKYNGFTRLAAYRADLAEAVSELKAANPSWDLYLAATDQAYTSVQSSYYLSTESANAFIHPNVTLGQPLMAAKIWEKLVLSSFYNNAAKQ